MLDGVFVITLCAVMIEFLLGACGDYGGLLWCDCDGLYLELLIIVYCRGYCFGLRLAW